MTTYFILSPYFGTSMGSIFYSLFAASPWPGVDFSEYLSNLTYLASVNSDSIFSLLRISEHYFLNCFFTRDRSLVSISTFSIDVIRLDVNGMPSLLTHSKPFP